MRVKFDDSFGRLSLQMAQSSSSSSSCWLVCMIGLSEMGIMFMTEEERMEERRRKRGESERGGAGGGVGDTWGHVGDGGRGKGGSFFFYFKNFLKKFNIFLV